MKKGPKGPSRELNRIFWRPTKTYGAICPTDILGDQNGRPKWPSFPTCGN